MKTRFGPSILIIALWAVYVCATAVWAAASLSEKEWQMLKDIIQSGGSVGSGPLFPANPRPNNQWFLTSDDGTHGCSEGAGTDVTFCRWDAVGGLWVPIVATGGETDTLGTVTARGNTSTGNDESNPFEILGTGAQASYGWSIDRTSTGASRFRCKEAAGLNKCNYYRQVDDTFEGGWQDKDGVAQWTFDGTTGAVTKSNVDTTTANNKLTIAVEAHWPVATCQNTTPQVIYDVKGTSVPSAACDPANTNQHRGYLEFDAAADEAFHDTWILPTGFVASKGINVHFRWKAAATTNAVGWCAQLVRVPDAATSNPSFPAQASGNCVSDTAKGTTLQENTATITGVTCTSCVAGDRVNVRISRDGDGTAVTDNMTGDAFLIMYGRTWSIEY